MQCLLDEGSLYAALYPNTRTVVWVQTKLPLNTGWSQSSEYSTASPTRMGLPRTKMPGHQKIYNDKVAYEGGFITSCIITYHARGAAGTNSKAGRADAGRQVSTDAAAVVRGVRASATLMSGAGEELAKLQSRQTFRQLAWTLCGASLSSSSSSPGSSSDWS